MEKKLIGLLILAFVACTPAIKKTVKSDSQNQVKTEKTKHHWEPKKTPQSVENDLTNHPKPHNPPKIEVANVPNYQIPEINEGFEIKSNYQNPNLEDWENTFGKDPKWMELYQASIVHYLQGLQYNLDRDPKLTLNLSMIVLVYGNKMTDTFYLAPEFAAYAKIRFEKSEELAAFLLRNPLRTVKD